MMGPGLNGLRRGRLKNMLVTAPAKMVTLLSATVCRQVHNMSIQARCCGHTQTGWRLLKARPRIDILTY